MMQDHKSLMQRWRWCSGWGQERPSVVFSHNGGPFIQKGYWRTQVYVSQTAVGYLNATINRKAKNTELEIGTDRSSQTCQNLRVDRYRSWFGPPWCRGLGYWMVRELNHTVFAVRTWTAVGVPGPVANTSYEHLFISHQIWSNHPTIFPWVEIQ
jgi:hypothetical protein